MKEYILVNPSNGKSETLDQMFMSDQEAKNRNDNLRSDGNDNRWIVLDDNDE